MTQKAVWANAGDINPEFVKGIVKGIKNLHVGWFDTIPNSLVLGVIATESSFRTKIVSGAGAVGLMQVKPSTYEWLKGLYPGLAWQGGGLENPIENVLAGMAFMHWIRLQPGLSFFAQIQAYNTGVGGYRKGSRAKEYAGKVLINSFAFII